MIRVGVNENVVLSKAEINDQGTLAVGFRELGTEVKTVAKASTIADEMNKSTDASESSGESTFLVFPPNLKVYGKEDIKEGKVIVQDFIDLKNQLHHILKRFTTDSRIRWNMLAGVNVNPADDNDVFAKVRIQTVADAIYTNIVTQFVDQAKIFLNKDDKPCRLLLVRQSANKHFGTFRKKFLDNQPFLEGMEIPRENSKMMILETNQGMKTKYHDAVEGFLPRFTDYELGRGLDNPIALKTKADSPATSGEDEDEVDGLFNAGAEDGDDGISFGVEETA